MYPVKGAVFYELFFRQTELTKLNTNINNEIVMGISQLISLKTGSNMQRKFKFLRFLGVNHMHQVLYRPSFKMAGIRKVLSQA